MINIINRAYNTTYKRNGYYEETDKSIYTLPVTIKYNTPFKIPVNFPVGLFLSGFDGSTIDVLYSLNENVRYYNTFNKALEQRFNYKDDFNRILKFDVKENIFYLCGSTIINSSFEVIAFFYKEVELRNGGINTLKKGVMISPKVFESKTFLNKKVLDIMKTFNTLSGDTEVVISDINMFNRVPDIDVNSIINLDDRVKSLVDVLTCEKDKLEIKCY
jgi:hypothetical protein